MTDSFMMQPSERLIDYLKSIEKFVSPARHLPADRPGVVTGAYGETNGIHEGQVFTQYEADLMLRRRVDEIAAGVNRWLSPARVITQNQFDALCSLSYNIGLPALASSTLLKLLNAGNYSGAADQFLVWNHVNGLVCNGLSNRRTFERSWFLETPAIETHAA